MPSQPPHLVLRAWPPSSESSAQLPSPNPPPPHPSTPLHSLSLEEYGLMSPSALFGGSFRAGAGGNRDTGSFRRCTFHPSSLPLPHSPKLLLPDATAPPGNARIEASSRAWQSQHTKGSPGRNAGALSGRARRSRPDTEFRRKIQGRPGPGRYREGWPRGGELLLSMGVVRPPWGSGAVE